MKDSKVHPPHVSLRPVPDKLRKLIPKSAESAHELWFLEINGKAPALSGLVEWLEKESDDLDKLSRNLRCQLGSKGYVRDKHKVQRGKNPGQENILEIKATRGHARLFAFFSETGDLIIATHTYWKTSKNEKQQNSEFAKAARLRERYMNARKHMEQP